METGIVLSNREVTPQVWQMIGQLAPVAHTSRLFGVASIEQAQAIMLKGYELGFSLSTSFEFIQVVDGKPSLSPRGALALLHNSKEIEGLKLTRLVDAAGKFTGYECYMKRGNFEHTARFTLEDGKRALLTEGSPTGNGKRGYGNWEKYPENMCQWRAIGFCADVVAPDITGGLTLFLKMPETESVQVDDMGNFINGTFETALPTPAPVQVLQKPQSITLDELVNNFGAEAIMAANEGKIPGTDEEVQKLAKKLLEGA